MTSLPSPRVAPDAPIHRHELVSNLNGLRGILLSGGGELANQSRPVRLTVLSDADARGLFGNDHASYHTYQLVHIEPVMMRRTPIRIIDTHHVVHH